MTEKDKIALRKPIAPKTDEVDWRIAIRGNSEGRRRGI
jgi:hypothetical protein